MVKLSGMQGERVPDDFSTSKYAGNPASFAILFIAANNR